MKSVLLFALLVGVANAACQFPPSLWCESKEVALQCEVYEQCKKWVWREDPQAPLVNFALYFESLCPDCRQFIVHQLYPTFTKLSSIMNLTLVPYGNAREKKVGNEWKFECQHGREECIGNLLETCAIHSLRDMSKIMPFIFCVESSQQSPMKAVKSCADKLGVPMDPILRCYNSSQGNLLEHQMALRTEALNPPHQYVPWVVLNGVHTEKINNEATSNLLKLICDTYTGPKPSACSQTEQTRVSFRSEQFVEEQ